MTDPTRRFSSRVENYVKYRPGYPPALVDLLRAECGLRDGSVVADVGSGTGILAELLLKSGCRVFGVEPNPEMRAAGERLLAGYPGFTSVDGTAEATTLPDRSCDFITAGQAFHWFDLPPTRVEFARILKPPSTSSGRRHGWVVLVWNQRQGATTPFLADYERLLETYSADYALVNHRRIEEEMIGRFFAPGAFRLASFENRQRFDYDGLKGRLLSSSYAPEAGHPNHLPMLEELRAIFDRHQENGQVALLYDTKVYYGQLMPSSR